MFDHDKFFAMPFNEGKSTQIESVRSQKLAEGFVQRYSQAAAKSEHVVLSCEEVVIVVLLRESFRSFALRPLKRSVQTSAADRFRKVAVFMC